MVKEVWKTTPFNFMVVLPLMPNGLHPTCWASTHLQDTYETIQTQLQKENMKNEFKQEAREMASRQLQISAARFGLILVAAQ